MRHLQHQPGLTQLNNYHGKILYNSHGVIRFQLHLVPQPFDRSPAQSSRYHLFRPREYAKYWSDPYVLTPPTEKSSYESGDTTNAPCLDISHTHVANHRSPLGNYQTSHGANYTYYVHTAPGKMLKSYLLGPEAQKIGHVSLNRQAKTKPSKACSLKPSGEGS